MSTRTTFIIIIAVTLLLLGAGSAFSSRLPDVGATHWNAQGEADGYSSKRFIILFLPIMGLGTSLLILFLPNVDPKKSNIDQFRSDYNLFVLIFLGFLGVVHILSLAWNLGYPINMIKGMVPILAILCYFIGNLLVKARQNWFIGIRTPWTLSSETVWNKTHQRAGVLYKISAGITLLGLLTREPTLTFIILFFPLLLVSFYAMIFSYFEYRREQRERQ